MGAQQEDQPLKDPVIITMKEKPDYRDHTVKTFFCHLKKHKERLLIGILLLVICILIGVLIAVSTRSASSNVNDKESEMNTIINVPGESTNDKSTDDGTTTNDQKCAPCKDGWIWYLGKCYYFSTESDGTRTWSNSQEFCKLHDASLAIIDNKQEYDFIFRYKGTENHWIGLSRTNDNKAWIWTNGALYDGSLFTVARSQDENIEHVYLNRDGVKSDTGTINYNWICYKTYR